MPSRVGLREPGAVGVTVELDLALADDLQTRFRMAVMNFDEKEVAELITDPNTIIALSDAAARPRQPRCAGPRPTRWPVACSTTPRSMERRNWWLDRCSGPVTVSWLRPAR